MLHSPAGFACGAFFVKFMFTGLLACGFTLWPSKVIGGRGTPGAFGVMQSSVSIVTDPGADFVS